MSDVFFVCRDRAVSAGMAFLHDHGGKLRGVGGAVAQPGLAVLVHRWQILQGVVICPLFLMLSYIW